MPTYDTFFFNWQAQVELESAWLTSVRASSAHLLEQRTLLAHAPYRTIRVQWTGVKVAEVQQIYAHLHRAASEGVRIPLYQDQAVTTASSSGTTINCPTAHRRFFVGFLVLIVALGENGRVGTWEHATISAVGASTITTGALTNTYPAGSLVFPLMNVRATLDTGIQWLASHVCSVAADFQEEFGPESLPSSTVNEAGFPTGVSTAALPTGNTFAIFPFEADWSQGIQGHVVRAGENYTRGRSPVVYLRGQRPQAEFSLNVVARTREDAWLMIQFFDTLKGRVFPFWLPHPAAIFDCVTFNTGFVDIVDNGTLGDVEDFVPYVALVKTDGTVQVRAVSSVTLVSGNWRVAVSAAFSAYTAADVRRFVPAYLVRMTTDVLREEWITSTVARFNVTCREVHETDQNLEMSTVAVEPG